jgi:hypothetical protein
MEDYKLRDLRASHTLGRHFGGSMFFWRIKKFIFLFTKKRSHTSGLFSKNKAVTRTLRRKLLQPSGSARRGGLSDVYWSFCCTPASAKL